MINKSLLLSCVIGVVVAVLVCCCVLNLCFNSNRFESDGACVIVDGSSLRVCNTEFIVTNSLSFCVRPTQKTSEWIYVYGADSEVWVDGHRLTINGTSIEYDYDDGKENASSKIMSELPILLRFFENKVFVAGSATWAKGRIVIEHIGSSYDVRIQVKKECRIVIKANWYEFTG